MADTVEDFQLRAFDLSGNQIGSTGAGDFVRAAANDQRGALNLIQIAMSLGFENVEYEPEAFPGLVYRMDDPKVVLLLFGSGKMVCVGAREVNDIKNAVRNIKEELSTAGLMRT